jgi:hypothetical protein
LTVRASLKSGICHFRLPPGGTWRGNHACHSAGVSSPAPAGRASLRSARGRLDRRVRFAFANMQA